MTILETIQTKPLAEVIRQYPHTVEFLENYNLAHLAQKETLAEAIRRVEKEELDEFGLTQESIEVELSDFLTALAAQKEQKRMTVESLTITGGQNKSGEAEDIELTICAGEVISIVGPTGSGKSRLLADIECLAQSDTPTRRTVRVNGRLLSLEERFDLGSKLVAQLSQNMNFIIDVSAAEFLDMHAKSRLIDDRETVIADCFACANHLAGEQFSMDTKVTQLSGGQSRALMIADTAYISESPIVLIDEIENAGIDRKEALAVLTKQDKIVLISTHDPLLALAADRRIVIKNGGIAKIIESTDEEKANIAEIERINRILHTTQAKLRAGERITSIGE